LTLILVPPSKPARVETLHFTMMRQGMGTSRSRGWWYHSSLVATVGPVAAWQAWSRSETARTWSGVCSQGMRAADLENTSSVG